MEPCKVGYIMSRFPHLPETFILREMIEMEKLGWEIALCPLIIQNQPVVHPQAQPFLNRAFKLPFLSPAQIFSNFRMWLKDPWLYLSTFLKVFKGNLSNVKFLIRALVVFPISVQMAELMQKENVRHIHAHYATHPALAAWVIHRLTRIPYSIAIHAHDIYTEKAMLQTKLEDAVFIAAISEFNRNYLINLYGSKLGEKISVIHCGVIPEDYIEIKSANSFDILKIVSTGSLQPYKGQKFLIDACRLLKERGIPFHCQIIGGGELFSSLSNQISSLGLENSVELLGSRTQSEVSNLLANANCYVQPSIITMSGKMEGIPVSIMEAMVCSIPVIATSISGIPELVQHKITGLLVPPEDANELVNALEWIRENPDETRRIVQNGRDLIINQFNLHKNVKQLSSQIQYWINNINTTKIYS